MEAFFTSGHVHSEEVVREWYRLCDLAGQANETDGAKIKALSEEKEELENKVLSMKGELETRKSLSAQLREDCRNA